MKINWSFVKGFLLIAVVLFLYGFSNYKNQDKKVTSIDIKFEKGDNLFMTHEMVNKLLIQNGVPVKNKAKSLIDLNSLEEQVLLHPMVESARTFLTVDGQLETRVMQRTPIGRISSNSESYYIDRLGDRMPLSENYSARVPIITGDFDGESLKDLYELLLFIRADSFLEKQIVGVHKVNNENFNLMTRVGKHEINIGKVDNLQSKFKNLKAFYNSTMKNETINNYSLINLKYNNQVVCTKR